MKNLIAVCIVLFVYFSCQKKSCFSEEINNRILVSFLKELPRKSMHNSVFRSSIYDATMVLNEYFKIELDRNRRLSEHGIQTTDTIILKQKIAELSNSRNLTHPIDYIYKHRTEGKKTSLLVDTIFVTSINILSNEDYVICAHGKDFRICKQYMYDSSTDSLYKENLISDHFCVW